MPTTEQTLDATSETVAENENMTADDLLGVFMGDAESVETEEVDDQSAPEHAEEEVADSAPANIMDRLGLATASDDDLRELASNLGGRFGSELGELRRENRTLRESLQTELQKREPFELGEQKENPYGKLNSVDELKDTYQSALETIKAGKAALRKHRNADPDDEVLEVGDRSLTYAEVEEMIETAQEARDQHLPERLQQLKQVGAYEDARKKLLDEVRTIHPWMTDDDNPLRKQVDETREKFLGRLQTHVPELVPYFDIILADHAQAVAQRAKGQPTQRKAPAKKPPSGPGSGAAASARPQTSGQSRQEYLDGFAKQGRNMTGDDLVQFLTS